MTWRYQILDHGTHYALHEVYDDGRSWTADPITFVCDPEEGSDGIIRSLEMALADARNLPVLKVTP